MSSLISKFPLLRPIRDEVEMNQLKEASAADHHPLIAPTFMIEKGGSIGGWVGLNSIPQIHGWLSPEVMTARDSCMVFSQIENMMRMQGARIISLFLESKSPFINCIDGLGWNITADGKLSMKVLI